MGPTEGREERAQRPGPERVGAVAVQVHHPMTRALIRGVIELDRLLRRAVLKLSYSELSPAKYEELCGPSPGARAGRVVEMLSIEIDEAVSEVPREVFERRDQG